MFATNFQYSLLKFSKSMAHTWNHCFVDLNPNWYEPWKQEKCSSLVPPRVIFYKTQWALQCQNNLIDVNFHLQKSLKFLIKILLTNSDTKSRGVGSALSHANQVGLKLKVLSNHFFYYRPWHTPPTHQTRLRNLAKDLNFSVMPF